MKPRWLLWPGLTLAMAIGALLLARSAMWTDWRTSHPANSQRGVVAAPGVTPPTRLWTFEPPERGAILASPLVAEDRILVPVIRDSGEHAFGVLYCLDRRSGKPVWRFDDGGHMQQSFSSPCLANRRLYFGDGLHQDLHGKLYCLDAATGKKMWDFATAGHVESSPCVAENQVFFGAGDDGVYALDAVTGRQTWHRALGAHVDTSPAVVGHAVYAGSGTSAAFKKTEVFALDVHDGHTIWHTPTDLPVWGSGTVDDGHAFFGLGNGRLIVHPKNPAGAVVCLDAASGHESWRWRGHEAVFDRPTVHGHHVYFGARDGFCYCLNRGNGQVQWQADLGSPVIAAPALLNGRVYAVASDGRLCRFQADTGQLDWCMPLNDDAYTKARAISTPRVVEAADGRALIYVGAELMTPAGSLAQLYALHD